MSTSRLRFTAAHPCPICGGHDREDRSRGQRCYGYLWRSGEAAICTREEHRGSLQPYGNTNGYLHALVGDCDCGQRHDPRPPSANGHTANGRGAVIVQAYDYRDADGTLLFQCVRYRPKGFKQRRPDGRGGWIWKLGDVKRVLYRLPELRASDRAEPVLVVEGEKDADNLASRGFVATTNAMGAGKWHPSYAEELGGRDVVIIGDNDDEGRGHTRAMAHSLRGVARNVVVLELDGLRERGDVSDWLNAGHTAQELRERIGSAMERVDGAAGRTAPDEHAKQDEAGSAPEQPAGQEPGRGVWRRMSSVPRKKAESLWRGYLYRGKLNLIGGDPSAGKSFLTMAIVAHATQGWKWPDGSPCPGPTNVILVCGEDDPEDTIGPRLDAVGADSDRVIHWDGMTTDDGGQRRPSLAKTLDVEELRRKIKEVDAGLVIIDPLNPFLDATTDTNRGNAVRAVTTPLADLARETGAAIVVVVHLNKTEMQHALYRISGSIDFIAAARSALAVGRDPENDEGWRLILSIKNNLEHQPSGQGFFIEDGGLRWDK